MTDRDSHRRTDPLHDTMDESDGCVVGAVDPDPTPIPDVVAHISALVGELDSDDRERLVDYIDAREHRGKVRKANEILRTVASEIDRDLPEWVRGIEAKCAAAQATAAEAVKTCAEERARREKHGLWKLIGGTVSVAGVISFLAWIGSSLDERYDAKAQERIRIQMTRDHETVLDEFKIWRAGVDVRLLDLRGDSQ